MTATIAPSSQRPPTEAVPWISGRRAAVALATVPPAFSWWLHPYPPASLLPLVVTGVVVVAGRTPRATPWAAMVGTGLLAWGGGAAVGLRYAGCLAVIGLVTGVAVGLDRGRFARQRAVSAPAVVLTLVGSASFLIPSKRLIVPELLLAAAAGAFVVAPWLPGPLRRVTAAVTARVRVAAQPTWGWFRRAARLPVRWTGRWWRAELPPTIPPGAGRLGRAPADGGASSRASGDGGLRWPVLAWGATMVGVTAFRLLTPAGDRPDGTWGAWSTVRDNLRHDVLVTQWMKWDAGQYLRIAERGYDYTPGEYFLPSGDQAPVAWFPGFSLVIRALRPLFGSAMLTSFWITVASGLAATVLLWTWTGRRGFDLGARRITTLLFLWYPWSFMLYGAGWSDALFVCLVLGAFVAFDAERAVLAGVLGGAAVLVRPNAIAVTVAFALAAVVAAARAGDDGPDRGPVQAARRVRAAGGPLVATTLSLVPVTAFVVWCGVRYGEPLLYWNAREQVFPSIDVTSLREWDKSSLLRRLLERWQHDRPGAANRALSTAAVGLVIFSLPVIRRRLGGVAAAFLGATLLVLWVGSHDFVGAGRYLMVAFPAFAAWGAHLARRPRLGVAVAAAGLPVLLVFTDAYTRTLDWGW